MSKSTSSSKPARSSAPRSKPIPAIPRPAGKLGFIIDLISKPGGATADELAAKIGWQRHSVLGALSRLRTRGFAMQLATASTRRAYSLDAPAGAR